MSCNKFKNKKSGWVEDPFSGKLILVGSQEWKNTVKRCNQLKLKRKRKFESSEDDNSESSSTSSNEDEKINEKLRQDYINARLEEKRIEELEFSELRKKNLKQYEIQKKLDEQLIKEQLIKEQEREQLLKQQLLRQLEIVKLKNDQTRKEKERELLRQQEIVKLNDLKRKERERELQLKNERELKLKNERELQLKNDIKRERELKLQNDEKEKRQIKSNERAYLKILLNERNNEKKEKKTSLLGYGAASCAFNPPPPCLNPQNSLYDYDTNYIALTNLKISKEKENLFKVIRSIPEYEKYYIVPELFVCDQMDFSQINTRNERCLDGFDKPVHYLKHGGTALGIFFNRTRPNFQETLKIAAHILNGVRMLHSKFVLHNDLHYSNIVVSSDQVPRIIDWNLSKVVSKVPKKEDSVNMSINLYYMFKFANYNGVLSIKSDRDRLIDYLRFLVTEDIDIHFDEILHVIRALYVGNFDLNLIPFQSFLIANPGNCFLYYPSLKSTKSNISRSKSSKSKEKEEDKKREKERENNVSFDYMMVSNYDWNDDTLKMLHQKKREIDKFDEYFILPEISASCQECDLRQAINLSSFKSQIKHPIYLVKYAGKNLIHYYNRDLRLQNWRLELPDIRTTILIMQHLVEAIYLLSMNNFFIYQGELNWNHIFLSDETLKPRIFLTDICSESNNDGPESLFNIFVIILSENFEMHKTPILQNKFDKLFKLMNNLVHNINSIRSAFHDLLIM